MPSKIKRSRPCRAGTATVSPRDLTKPGATTDSRALPTASSRPLRLCASHFSTVITSQSGPAVDHLMELHCAQACACPQRAAAKAHPGSQSRLPPGRLPPPPLLSCRSPRQLLVPRVRVCAPLRAQPAQLVRPAARVAAAHDGEKDEDGRHAAAGALREPHGARHLGRRRALQAAPRRRRRR